MLDAVLRPLIDPPLNRLGRMISATGLSANAITSGGALLGVAAAACIAAGHFTAALILMLGSRLLDGLDGAVARASRITDLGGYLDIVADYVFYAAIPVGFAFADPPRNALPAAALLGSFTLTGASFLTFAIFAARRGLETTAQGRKSFFYSSGIMEGSETIGAFAAMILWPRQFPTLAWVTAALCILTVAQRLALARRSFG